MFRPLKMKRVLQAEKVGVVLKEKDTARLTTGCVCNPVDKLSVVLYPPGLPEGAIVPRPGRPERPAAVRPLAMKDRRRWPRCRTRLPKKGRQIFGESSVILFQIEGFAFSLR